MSAPARTRSVARPVVIYDFSQPRIAERLTPLAQRALRRAGFGTHRLEADLRNYLNHSGLTEVRPIRVAKIVNRYVDVRPRDFADMETALGRKSARAFYTEVPKRVWWVQDFLDDLDIHRGYRLRERINDLIQRGPTDGVVYNDTANTHLRRSGYRMTHVLNWIREDPYRWDQWRREITGSN